jgi:hypothetical protein
MEQMGQTKAQIAAREASLENARAKREAREQAARKVPRIRTIDQVENDLVVLAWSVTVDGKDAVPSFELAERTLAAMRRAEALLQERGVKNLIDLKPYIDGGKPLTREEADARGLRRWRWD